MLSFFEILLLVLIYLNKKIKFWVLDNVWHMLDRKIPFYSCYKCQAVSSLEVAFVIIAQLLWEPYFNRLKIIEKRGWVFFMSPLKNFRVNQDAFLMFILRVHLVFVTSSILFCTIFSICVHATNLPKNIFIRQMYKYFLLWIQRKGNLNVILGNSSLLILNATTQCTWCKPF